MAHTLCRFACSIALSGIVLSSAVSQSRKPSVFSERAGEVIDPIERSYFALFPSVRDFGSASILTHDDGTATVTINHQSGDTGATVSYSLTSAQREEFRRFIDDFEMILIDEQKIRLDLLAGIVRIPDNRIGSPASVTLRTRSGRIVKGSLLHADEGRIFLWTGEGPYSWRRDATSVGLYRDSDIASITIVKQGKFWSGAGTGALVGGLSGALIGYASADSEGMIFNQTAGNKAVALGIGFAVLGGVIGGIHGAISSIHDEYTVDDRGHTLASYSEKLRPLSFFSSVPPPELAAISPSIRDEHTDGRTFESSTPEVSGSPHEMLGIHITAGGSVWGTAAAGDVSKAFTASGFGGTMPGFFAGSQLSYPMENGVPLSWNVGLAWDVYPRFRLGLSWLELEGIQVEGKDLEIANIGASSVDIIGAFDIVPADPLASSRVGIALEAGVSYNWISLDGALDANFGSAYDNGVTRFGFKKRGVGFLAGGSVDYYLFRFASLFGAVHVRSGPSLEVPAMTHVNTYNNESKTLQAHTVGFSGYDYRFGVRVHL